MEQLYAKRPDLHTSRAIRREMYAKRAVLHTSREIRWEMYAKRTDLHTEGGNMKEIMIRDTRI